MTSKAVRTEASIFMRFTVIFLSQRRHRKPYAKHIDARQRTTSRQSGNFQSRKACRRGCDEVAVPRYRHAPKCCLMEEGARPEICYRSTRYFAHVQQHYREKYLCG